MRAPAHVPPRSTARRRRGRRSTGRRTAAVLALVGACWTIVFTLAVAIVDFPRGLLVLGCGLLVAAGAWEGVLRRGWGRVAGLAVSGAGLLAFGAVLANDGFLRTLLLLGLGALIWHTGARLAFRPDVDLPAAEPPRRPVLVINPRSGDGKAAHFSLAAEARDRGIEPVELGVADDLAALLRAAVDEGAGALAVAGGDGSQAVGAEIAAERGLPYACIPAGTRNHFALDLGVDRDDVVGALDAFVDGGERRVDLAEVNGQVFVNNVSRGLYADAVQRTGYRDAKTRTILDTVPKVLGPEGTGLDLRWTGPGGHQHGSGAAILVSNNRYRLGRAVGSGTRPTIEDGLLGITVLGSPTDREANAHRLQRPWREWTTPAFEVAADPPVPAGIDGEATKLAPPLQFRIRPSVLRVRI